jgi:hypothetical protein
MGTIRATRWDTECAIEATLTLGANQLGTSILTDAFVATQRFARITFWRGTGKGGPQSVQSTLASILKAFVKGGRATIEGGKTKNGGQFLAHSIATNFSGIIAEDIGASFKVIITSMRMKCYQRISQIIIQCHFFLQHDFSFIAYFCIFGLISATY